ncbi:MAG: hypothetical protein AAFX39_09370 [Pseudomonadota bacterium]
MTATDNNESSVPDSVETLEEHEIDDRELIARRRKRSIALAISLGAMVILFYALTLIKLGPRVFDRAL